VWRSLALLAMAQDCRAVRSSSAARPTAPPPRARAGRDRAAAALRGHAAPVRRGARVALRAVRAAVRRAGARQRARRRTWRVVPVLRCAARPAAARHAAGAAGPALRPAGSCALSSAAAGQLCGRWWAPKVAGRLLEAAQAACAGGGCPGKGVRQAEAWLEQAGAAEWGPGLFLPAPDSLSWAKRAG